MGILAFLDRIPLSFILIACMTLGLAPFIPEPHIWEKLKMLADGSLRKPIDVFDLFWHAWPFLLLLIKLGRMALLRQP